MRTDLGQAALVLLMACWLAPVLAQSETAGAPAPVPLVAPRGTECAGAIKRCALVKENKLAALRGGYDAGNGLQVSFGIERMTYVNGQLVTQSQLTVPELGKLNAGQAAGLAALTDARGLVQLGAGNAVRIDQQPAAPTIIQNSLDNQTIRNLTVINTTSNSMQLLRGVNSQLALREALTLPLGVR